MKNLVALFVILSFVGSISVVFLTLNSVITGHPLSQHPLKPEQVPILLVLVSLVSFVVWIFYLSYKKPNNE